MDMRNTPHTGMLRLFILVLILSLFSLPLTPTSAQDSNPIIDPSAQAQLLLNELTPEERVGQLFLVTFNGVEISPDLPIYTLINEHHIGGVVLLAKKDNIIPANSDPKSIPGQVQKLIQTLQETEWNSSTASKIDPTTGLSYLPNYIPLFIATTQEGNGAPYDQILSGLTELPNQMAIGATWDSELAAQTGAILGKELSSLGINLLLGPSLDILDLPQIEITKNLGTRTFGGDPFWVGEMGRAYIRGIHLGSNGNLAVAAKHFPGHGGSDRLPEEEVATVRKSLDELKSIDLAPFIAATGNALAPEEAADALLSSHIRYQGLQGNIRATTRPVSLDPQALGLLMELPGLANWRQNGGVLISDDLGNMAIRRFYSLTNQTFDPRRVALNAFLAGNDILYFADFSTSNNIDSFSEAVRTLDFFAQKYHEDPAFAKRVDESVLRILTLKYRLYAGFSLDNVNPKTDALAELGLGSAVTSEVARNSATLLSPSQAELDTTIPDPPNQNDRITFIVDTRTAQQCSTCAPQPIVGVQSLQDAVFRLYGPQTGGLVSINNLSSYSFDELSRMLDTPSEAPEIERDLSQAHWIVMATIGDSDEISSNKIMKRFLAERPDLFQQKRLIVFAFSAPYYLDATNISKLTAYYALYSKATPFIETAAYLLFGELRATGAPPVSVPGIGYNLNNVLFPNPDLVIPLEFDFPPAQQAITTTATLEPTPPPEFRIGDVIPLRTGVILDFNGNPVPDGTPVNFVFSYGGETTSIRQTAYTQKGISRTTYAVAAPGALQIIAESENARSAAITLDISLPSGEIITPSNTPEPTQTPTPIPPTLTPEPTVIPPIPTVIPPREPGMGEWLFTMMISFGLAFAVYQVSIQFGNSRWGIRSGILALIGGLSGYIYIISLPADNRPLSDVGLPWNVLLVSLTGALIGLLTALIWRAMLIIVNRLKSRKSDLDLQQGDRKANQE